MRILIDAVQAEYSPFETVHETNGLIDACKELHVAFVAFSPLGHGFLVDDFQYKSPEDFAPDDFRRVCKLSLILEHKQTKRIESLMSGEHIAPKFQGENFFKNKAIVEEIKELAVRKGCTLAQIALAWVAAQGLISIPGTTKVKRLEENWASRDIELTEDDKVALRSIIDNAKLHGKRFDADHEATVGN
ncbi:hypothetical protein ACHAO3_001866 [Verticillium nonalfalfae]